MTICHMRHNILYANNTNLLPYVTGRHNYYMPNTESPWQSHMRTECVLLTLINPCKYVSCVFVSFSNVDNVNKHFFSLFIMYFIIQSRRSNWHLPILSLIKFMYHTTSFCNCSKETYSHKIPISLNILKKGNIFFTYPQCRVYFITINTKWA